MDKFLNYKSLARQRRGLLLPVVAPSVNLAEQDMQQLEQHLARVADAQREAANLAYAVYGIGYARIIAAELAAYEQMLRDARRELEKRNPHPRPLPVPQGGEQR